MGEPIPRYNEFPSSVLSTPINHSNQITTDSLASLPLSSLSLSTASPVSDTRSFSVTSETIRRIEEDTGTDITDFDSFESDSLGHFSSSVERHKLLCQALQKLDNRIRGEAEQLVLNASKNVSNAKKKLEAGRKEAAETVERLKEANDIFIQLPWASSGGDDTISVRDHLSMVPNGISLDPRVITSVGVTFPPSPTLLPQITIVDSPNHQSALNVQDARNSPNIVSVPTSSTSFIYPNEDIFPRYEDMMSTITMRGSQGLWPWDIPWPILTLSNHDYPPKTCDPLMASDTLNDNLEVFVMFYTKWKGRPLCQTRSAMLLDWTAIVDRIPVWMRKEKATAESVLDYLSPLS